MLLLTFPRGTLLIYVRPACVISSGSTEILWSYMCKPRGVQLMCVHNPRDVAEGCAHLCERDLFFLSYLESWCPIAGLTPSWLHNFTSMPSIQKA